MSIRWIQDGEPHVAEVYNRPLRDFVLEAQATYIPNSRKVTVSNGISGGGMLTGDIEITGDDASTTQVGVSRFATVAELQAGSAQNVGVTPSALAQLPLGVGAKGQKWYNVLPQRVTGATYYNTTSNPIVAVVMSGMDNHNTNYVEIWCYIDGHRIPICGFADEFTRSKALCAGSVIIPPSSSYRFVYVSQVGTQPKMREWFELR